MSKLVETAKKKRAGKGEKEEILGKILVRYLPFKFEVSRDWSMVTE